MTACRVCRSPAVEVAGVVEYLPGYAWEVHDCHGCGCRFTRHDPEVHERLHQQGSLPYYADYRRLAEACQRSFAARDVVGLRRFLEGWSKYRFVMDAVDAAPAEARILEVGASRGYLTSYAIARGRSVLGVDVSREAVGSATRAFGDRFASLDSGAMEAGAPWDMIYHVGMIGCVADPLGLTRHLLSLLRPGGWLLFNAPNLQACRLAGALWLDSAPPPDLVTLFPPGFWPRQLGASAEVTESVELHDAARSFRLAWGRRFGGWERAGRLAGRLADLSGLSRLVRRWPTEFGLFVEMRAA